MQSSGKPAGKSKVRILVVDDENDIAYTVKRGLESKGYFVDAYSDPRRALSEYKVGQYDLLLIDIRMPTMNGFELYKKIQNIDPIVKICFITAYEIYYDEFRRVFPKIKVSCFVKKPVSIEELGRIIASELGIEEQETSILENRNNG